MKEFINNFAKPLLFQKKINIVVEEVNEIPRWATTDWVVYEQILFHLFQNAIKFGKKGSYTQLNKDRREVIVSIEYVSM